MVSQFLQYRGNMYCNCSQCYLYNVIFVSEAAQMKFLRHLLGITKLDKEKNQCIREKMGAQNILKEIKQYQKKVVTTHTEDGHK